MADIMIKWSPKTIKQIEDKDFKPSNMRPNQSKQVHEWK